MTIYYVASSGNTYRLYTKKMVRISSANFHDYAWKYDTSELQYGANINRFTKDVATYEIELTFTGSKESRRSQIVSMHNDFERDIINQSPGRLVWGDCYIDGYVVESSTSPFEGMHIWTTNKIIFMAPNPFWIQEVSHTYAAVSTAVDNDDKQYTATAYGYPYSYVTGSGAISLSLDYYSGCDFKMVAYGPFAELYVTMGGNIYNVDYPVASGEYMVIDSRQNGNLKGQAYVVDASGNQTNVFNYRNPYYSLYERVPAGSIIIQYTRAYKLDVTFYMERSEPIVGDASNNYATLLDSEGDILTVLR